MSKWTSTLLLLLGFACSLNGQRAELEQRRNSLLKKIEATNTLIKKSQQSQQTTESDIRTLNAEIALRTELLNTLNTEMQLVEASVSDKESTISMMRNSMDELQSLHSAYLKQEYIQKRTENRTIYVLSAASLNEAYARWRYLRAFKTAREHSFSVLRTASDSIQAEVADLVVLRDEKEVLLTDVQEQEDALASSIASSEVKLNTLRKDENKLNRDLERQRAESARLATEIENVIKAEIAKNTSKSAMPNAPAMTALSAEFETNKGKLPWPVERGIITGHFGTQPHPVIPSIKIANNGIDITAPAGAQVKAIFGGKVVGKKQIPGYDHTVIVQHGSYYTVYSRLAQTGTTLGSTIRTGDVLGTLSASNNTNGKLHIEVWKGKTQLDPELWLTR